MIENKNEQKARARAEETIKAIQERAARAFQLNRRQFVGTGMAAAVVAMLGAAGCSPQSTSASSGEALARVLTPGTYVATGQGRNGEITVSATFSETALEAIEADHAESKNIGDAAIELLTDKYLTAQSIKFDAITGATMTSLGFTTAVSDCIEQAGGDIRDFQKDPTGIEPAAAIEEECDVCVIGSGGAAFVAAVTALEAGKSVVMLDKMDIFGGNTNAGGGVLNAPDPERQAPRGVEDSTDLFYEQTFTGGGSTGDPALVRILADNSLDAVHWMEAHGLVWLDELYTAIGAKWERSHQVKTEVEGEPGGAYYVSCLKDCADASDLFTLHVDAKVESLNVEDGKVTSVSGTRPSSGAAVSVKAKSFVLATGGYARNAELAMEYDQRVTKDMASSNVVSATGDGLIMARDIGAGVRNVETVQIHPLGDPQNGGVSTFVGSWLGVENYVFVNEKGTRFIAEDSGRDELVGALLSQTNDEMWLLIDSTNVKSDKDELIADLVAKEHSLQSEDIKGLADQMGVSADALVATIDGYNAGIAAGADTQLTPGKKLLGAPLATPSYYASKRIPTIHYTMGGLCISTGAQVCKEDGTPIPNLFAAGEVAGGVQGSNRLGGNSFTELVVFGRIAGASAAANA